MIDSERENIPVDFNSGTEERPFTFIYINEQATANRENKPDKSLYNVIYMFEDLER